MLLSLSTSCPVHVVTVYLTYLTGLVSPSMVINPAAGLPHVAYTLEVVSLLSLRYLRNHQRTPDLWLTEHPYSLDRIKVVPASGTWYVYGQTLQIPQFGVRSAPGSGYG